MNRLKVSSRDSYLFVELLVDKNEKISTSLVYLSNYLTKISGFLKYENNTYTLESKPETERLVLEYIDALIGAYGELETIYDSAVNTTIVNYKNEQDDFRQFTDSARRIRDDESHNYNELLGFEDSLRSLNRELFWHQKLSAYHLSFARNACNFSVPGAGKTTVVYAAFNYLRLRNEVSNIVIVGPSSSSIAWENEYYEVFGRKPKILKINGETKGSEITKLFMEQSPEVIHITYESVDKYGESLKLFFSLNKSMLVADEAHRMKNTEGFRAQSLLKLVKDYESSPVSRVVLTGTPAPNSYRDLYNLFKFIWPKNDIIGFQPKQLDAMSKKPYIPSNKRHIKQLVDNISPFFIRVKKNDLNLPIIKINSPHLIKMDSKQQQIYNFIRDDLVKFMKMSKNAKFGSRLIRLRQAASNPSLLNTPILLDNIVYDNNNEIYLAEIRDLINSYDQTSVSQKFIDVIKLINQLNEQNKRAVIWCEFIKSAKMLGDLLENENIRFRYLTGSVETEDRKNIVAEFNSFDSKFEFIIATTLAVGESVSLHKMCHNAIYFEQSYNAGLYIQSMDRIHRLGLDKNTVTEYFYIQSADSIEEHVFQRLLQKEDTMKKIIDSNEIPLLANYKDLFDNSDDSLDLREFINTQLK